ncbi:DUF1203 domain-containing protein [Mesorhizobium sp. ANAO-SY3R2]|uniref:DUF1203 domain-containing protein n=1 Tax=Mesorhizobium sp. ANAO-SY3R2 TaxID=3166644 RepID=UPI00366B2E66
MTIRFQALPTDAVRALQNGAPDAYGMTPERKISDGDGVPCRHCLRNVDAGEPYLVLAYRPFPELQPYAESGPIFLHAEECARAAETAELPELFARTRDYILRGYSTDDRIVYGTGAVTPTPEIVAKACELLQRPDVAYVHMRSARNNCYQCRIERDEPLGA